MSRLSERDLELEMLNGGEPPEVWQECGDCQGEGSVDEPRPFYDDPYFSVVVTCETCNGAGGFICEVEDKV